MSAAARTRGDRPAAPARTRAAQLIRCASYPSATPLFPVQ